MVFAMSLMTSGAALAEATVVGSGTDVGTSLTPGQTSGAQPIVKVKWEMKGKCFSTDSNYNNCTGVKAIDPTGVTVSGEGLDDNMSLAGAQFNAPGKWGDIMKYTVCAIVTDPNGVGDIDAVYADIYYPTDRPMHKSSSDPTNPNYDPDEIDNPSGGCNAFIEQNSLKKLNKDDGIDLFCNWVRVRNNNLPTFGTYITEDDAVKYEEICNPQTGELPEEEAYVYCDDKTLTWEDPAGNYTVKVAGHDSDGPGTALENTFKYNEYTGFEIDFNSIKYQNVIKDVRNQVSGDRNFDPTASTMPTVRNIGNTRLNMLVAQDDMDFGFRDGNVWNVGYDARVGNKTGDWHGFYNPFKLKTEAGDPSGIEPEYSRLKEILNLSETEKMDFVILVNKWSKGTTFPYSGSMWLDAERAEFGTCVQPSS